MWACTIRPGGGTVQSSIFTFAIDFVDEGVDDVVTSVGDRGLDGVALAAAYHHARDVFPHNPARKLYYHEGGVVFFRPESWRYDVIRPQESALVRHQDLLREVCAATEKRSMKTTAWTVYLHNSRLASRHPGHTPRNAFGDRNLSDLCPSDPAVRRFALALTEDICRYPIDSIMAEALHFKPIEHGHHHERYFVDLGATAMFLLGLCFCDGCLENARSGGVDAEGVREFVASFLDSVFDAGSGSRDPIREAEIRALCGGEMAGYLDARAASVSSLVGDAAAIAEDAGVRFTFSAHGGSAKGGSTRSSDHPSSAWMLGVDIGDVVTRVDTYEILGYVGSLTDLESLTKDYLEAIAPAAPALALRPMFPDTADADDLSQRVRLARDLGIERLDFYHYGLMPGRSLDWIEAAIT